MYQPRREGRSEFVPIRNHRYHARLWGEPGAGKTPLVLLHGWMDVAASWQFVVDAFEQDHFIVAPDWRGFGATEGPPVDNYWFPDYLADLDFLLDHYAPGTPVHLAGHSMGGNVAMLYSGVRPERIRRLVNLEGFGMPASRPSQAPGRYAKWMDELKALHQGGKALQTYESVEGVAQRLMKTNRRLAQDKALWLARHWARPGADGRWQILGDAAHKVIGAHLYRVEETLECARRITAPVLWVEASDDSLAQWWQERYTLEEFHERLKAVPELQKARVEDAGHMLHHDQPHQVARLTETFFAISG
jgi:pimeloyl-ACP methyl ester carboxylesterase